MKRKSLIIALFVLGLMGAVQSKIVMVKEYREMHEIVHSDQLTKEQKLEQLEAYLERAPTMYGAVLYRIAEVDQARATEIALKRFRMPTTSCAQKYVLGDYLLYPYSVGGGNGSDADPAFVPEYKAFIVDAILNGGKEEFCVAKIDSRTAVGEYATIAGGIGSLREIDFSCVADPQVIPVLMTCLSAPDHVYAKDQGCLRRGNPGESTGRNTQRQGIPLALAKLGAVESIPELKRIVRKHHDYNFRCNAAYALGKLSNRKSVKKLASTVRKAKEPSFLFHFGKGLMAREEGEGIQYLDFRYSLYFNKTGWSAILYMTEERLLLIKEWEEYRTVPFYRQALSYKPLQNILIRDFAQTEFDKRVEEKNKEQIRNIQKARFLQVYEDLLYGIALNDLKELAPLIRKIESETMNPEIRVLSGECLKQLLGKPQAQVHETGCW